MFCLTDVSDEIERTIPALHPALHTAECEKSLYKQVGVLSRYAAEKACCNEMTAVRGALHLADNLYRNGNTTVRGAIESVLVFSLDRTLGRLGTRRTQLLGIVPATLLALYLKQVLHTGC